jgi:hypothetical protein
MKIVTSKYSSDYSAKERKQASFKNRITAKKRYKNEGNGYCNAQ